MAFAPDDRPECLSSAPREGLDEFVDVEDEGEVAEEDNDEVEVAGGSCDLLC